MTKMPSVLKIWIGESSYSAENDDKDVKKIVAVGDEVSLTSGTERSRTTDYTVTSVWGNCMEIKRQDIILAEKRQELQKKLEAKTKEARAEKKQDTREPIDEETTDPEAEEIRANNTDFARSEAA